jgi:hypothetical protein
MSRRRSVPSATTANIAGFNLTDHFNPEAIHTNIDDPVYGAFVGQHGRRYTADFDVLF